MAREESPSQGFVGSRHLMKVQGWWFVAAPMLEHCRKAEEPPWDREIWNVAQRYVCFKC